MLVCLDGSSSQYKQFARRARIKDVQTKSANNRKSGTKRSLRCRVTDAFHAFARRASTTLGSAWAFVGAILIIVVWAFTGPAFHFSDTWQLIINTGTTIVTFLMVFLIQNTQNRDAKAVHLKLDELIRAVQGARNKLVDLEALSDEDLSRLEREFQHLRRLAEHKDKATERVTRKSEQNANSDR